MRLYTRCPDAEFPKPGTWRPVKVDGSRSAVIACPNACGFKSALGYSHKIASDGTVSPSVICGNEACDFHDWIKLEGWTP